MNIIFVRSINLISVILSTFKQICSEICWEKITVDFVERELIPKYNSFIITSTVTHWYDSYHMNSQTLDEHSMGPHVILSGHKLNLWFKLGLNWAPNRRNWIDILRDWMSLWRYHYVLVGFHQKYNDYQWLDWEDYFRSFLIISLVFGQIDSISQRLIP